MSNPLLSKVKLPGRIFQLPSKGLFYEPGVLADHITDGEIEVQALSAIAEMKLKSPDMLFTGRAVREVVLECIPDILIPELLISKDVDAIFCFLKIVTYGSIMNIKSTHSCNERKVHTYNVNIEDIILNPNNEALDKEFDIFKEVLSNEQVIFYKPVRFLDTINIAHARQNIENLIKKGITDQNLMEDTMIKDMLCIIKSVDGHNDIKMLEEWIRALPRKLFDEVIDRSQNSIEWGFNLNVNLTCKDCNAVFKHSLELDPVGFFSG